MHNTDAIFSEVRRLVALLNAEERLARIRDILTAPISTTGTSSNTDPDPQSGQVIQRRKKMQAEQECWYGCPKDERSQYAGSYVALQGGDVVDHDTDCRALYLRIRKHFGNEPVPIIPAKQVSLPELIIRNSRMVYMS